MWYHGGPWGPRDMIGYATSDDGVTWTKYEGNPVLHNSYLYLPLAMRNYDTYLYDNFDKPAYDGTFDPGLWSLHWTSEVKDIFHAEQHDGAMVMWNSLPAAMGGGEFVTMQPLLRTLQQLQMYEARLKISSDRVGGLSQVGLFIKTFDEINGRYWFTQCVLQASGDAQQATYACHVMTQDPGTGDSTLEHGTPAVTVPYDTWHTARIEVNPATAEFRYYLDGTPIDTYVPNDAPALIAETNIRASLLAWNDYADAASTRYVDDVRIAPARP
jgi:hypothetical protein